MALWQARIGYGYLSNHHQLLYHGAADKLALGELILRQTIDELLNLVARLIPSGVQDEINH